MSGDVARSTKSRAATSGFLLRRRCGIDIRYKLNVDGRDWANGALKRLTRIGAGERATHSIPIDLDFTAIGSGVRRMLISDGRADYDFSRALMGTAGQKLIGDFELSFEDSGTAGVGR